jgi:tetratricopeptide (TPR) repeat protein
LAQLLSDRGEDDEAIKHLQIALTHEPDNPRLWIACATRLRSAGRFDEAIDAFRKWLELDPKEMSDERSGKRRLAWIRHLLRVGQMDGAIQCCQALVEVHPEHLEFWRGLLLARLMAKDQEGFRQDFTRLFKRFEQQNNIPVSFLTKCCAVAPFAVSELDQVVELARDSAKQHPRDPRARHVLGCILYRAGDWVEAAAALEQAAKLRRHTSFDDWIWQSMAEFRVDNPGQAFTCLWRADEQINLRRPPRWSMFEADLLYQEALGLLGVQLPDSDLVETVERTKEATDAGEQQKHRKAPLCDHYDDMIRIREPRCHEQSIRILERLTDLAPDVPEYQDSRATQHYSLGWSQFNLGRMDAARSNYQRAIELWEDLAGRFPSMTIYRVQLAGSCCNLGSVLCDEGEAQAALSWYSRGQELLEAALDDGEDTMAKEFLRNVHWNWADALLRLARPAEAAQDYERALELGSTTHELIIAWLIALARAEDWDTALAQAAKLAEDEDSPYPSDLYTWACVFAVASGAKSDDAELQEQYATQALDLLRKAREEGFKAKVPELNAWREELRQQAEFQRLSEEMEKMP